MAFAIAPVEVPQPHRCDNMLASDWWAPDGQCDRWQPFANRQKQDRVPRWQQGVATTLPSGPGYHVCGSTALWPKRRIQRHLRVQQRPESEVHVEGLGHIVFRSHDQRIG